MKLVGEYELTDNGVKIVGKINDSHIHEVRQLLKPFKTIRLYRGDVENSNQVYHVPHQSYRPYIMRHVPGIITPEKDAQYVALPKKIGHDLDPYYLDAQTFAHNMGIMYGDGEGRNIMDNRHVFQYSTKKRTGTRLLTNSAWVWGADERGNFEIEIFGLVNRHMMTVLLSNATQLAKYIDNVLVRTLDKADEFSAEKIAERNPARRVLNAVW